MTFQVLNINQVGAFRAPIHQGFRIACGWTLVILAALAAVFFLKLDGTFSRVWMLGWYLPWPRRPPDRARSSLSLVTRHMTRTGRLDRRTVIVGGGHAGETLLRDLGQQIDTDIRICGVFDDRNDDRSPDVVAGYPKLGNIDDLVAMARHTRIDLDHLHPADHGRAAPAADAAQIVGAADRYPAVGPYEQAQAQAPVLFVYRVGPGPRRLRQADRRLGRCDQEHLRPSWSARWR